ncbi:hypothetical protein [Nonomuraea longicatena]|uniref:Uncharacterized protein n=1 Tax=Nonomuraea longicatena TaxID=83682 RepID=A0ABP3ZTS4_9ACTN
MTPEPRPASGGAPPEGKRSGTSPTGPSACAHSGTAGPVEIAGHRLSEVAILGTDGAHDTGVAPEDRTDELLDALAKGGRPETGDRALELLAALLDDVDDQRRSSVSMTPST